MFRFQNSTRKVRLTEWENKLVHCELEPEDGDDIGMMGQHDCVIEILHAKPTSKKDILHLYWR